MKTKDKTLEDLDKDIEEAINRTFMAPEEYIKACKDGSLTGYDGYGIAYSDNPNRPKWNVHPSEMGKDIPQGTHTIEWINR